MYAVNLSNKYCTDYINIDIVVLLLYFFSLKKRNLHQSVSGW